MKPRNIVYTSQPNFPGQTTHRVNKARAPVYGRVFWQRDCVVVWGVRVQGGPGGLVDTSKEGYLAPRTNCHKPGAEQ